MVYITNCLREKQLLGSAYLSGFNSLLGLGLVILYNLVSAYMLS